MNKKMTKRERVMVIGLAVLVFAGAYIFLLLMPALGKIDETKEMIAGYETQKSNMSEIIRDKDKLFAEGVNKRSEVEAEHNVFEVFSKDTDITQYLTVFCKDKHNLSPINLKRTAYNEPIDDKNIDALYYSEYNVSVTGTISSLNDLIADAAENPFLVLQDIRYSTLNETYNLTFKIYTNNKISWPVEPKATTKTSK